MRNVRPDPDKASSLVKMSDKILERVKELRSEDESKSGYGKQCAMKNVKLITSM